MLGGFHLGTRIDAEPNGLPSLTADGDDMLNLDDEDGVVFLRTARHAGDLYAARRLESDGHLHVLSAGYLQGWMDFNEDGDWLDAGEHIIADRMLGTGVYDITFPVPASATVGNTFARFRYSIGCEAWRPAGHSTAGEVEDYAVRSCPTNRWPTPTASKWLQDVDRAPLDVLANDFPSSTGVLRNRVGHPAPARQRADSRPTG